MFAFRQAVPNVQRDWIYDRPIDSGFERVRIAENHLQRCRVQLQTEWNRHCNLSVSQFTFLASSFCPLRKSLPWLDPLDIA
jgi:hypothetical protein